MELPPFEPDLARASTLPGWCYTDADWFRLERERIFARSWQPVGRLEQVRQPGDYFTAEIVGEPLVVLRDREGRLRAFANVCRHRAGAVAEGAGNRKSLQCAYHGWTYGLDGQLQAAPEFEGVLDFDPRQCRLPEYQTASWGPLVLVNLDAAAPPLETTLGDIPAETRHFSPEGLVLRKRRDYVVPCNWKVYIDNYLEGYHIPLAHPGLYREVNYPQYRVQTFPTYAKQHAPLRQKAVPGGDGQALAALEQALYYWIFPSWMLNLYPGNLQVNIVVPLDAERTLTIFEWYFPPGGSHRDAIDAAVAFSDQVQREDIRLCQAVQERLHSRTYQCGRFSVQRENGVHHFQGLVRQWLGR